MKTLLEDYKRKLDILKNTTGLDEIAETRIKTKRSCYRTFITELEREIQKQEPSDARKMYDKMYDKTYDLDYDDCVDRINQ